MEIEGRIENIAKDFLSGKYRITILTDNMVFLQEAQELSLMERLTITFNRYVKHRSLNANSLFWDCVDKLSKAQKPPVGRWEMYLHLLKEYGTYTFIIVRPEAVEAMKRQWREVEEMGHINVNGEDGVQLQCWYGSSAYNTKDFSVLLEGTIQEMVDCGLVPPTSEKMKRSLELWEKHQSQS